LAFSLAYAGEEAQTVVPLEQNEAAPFTGMLVEEGRFTELTEAELDAEELRSKLKIKDRLLLDLESVYTEKLKAATRPAPWYQSMEFQRWLGFALGVAVTAIVYFGSSQLVEATK